MTYPWCRVMFVSLVAVSDISVYLYDVYVTAVSDAGGEGGGKQPVSHAAHISGALTGLLVGIICLKNLRWEQHERYIWAVSGTTPFLVHLSMRIQTLLVIQQNQLNEMQQTI